ncbi:DUF6264 family protein [Herbiconiux solani]|uniref:DUF6264 family protein n=1 Tax=Herbiconiux solani TaxID=661329 RepID=UPI0008240823|nr:DUF6264 family protein [Herbiconiux solani]
MSDERPKPKYGELAPEGWSWTPPKDPAAEEAEAGAGAGMPGTGTTASGKGASATGASTPAKAPRQAAARQPTPPPPYNPAAAAMPDRKRGDMIATFLLLAAGVISTTNTVVSMLQLPAVMQQVMDIYKIDGAYAGTSTAQTAGSVGAALLVLIFALTVYISVRRLRVNKLTFFVPLIGAVLSFAVSTACIAIAFFADPALVQGFSTLPS